MTLGQVLVYEEHSDGLVIAIKDGIAVMFLSLDRQLSKRRTEARISYCNSPCCPLTG